MLKELAELQERLDAVVESDLDKLELPNVPDDDAGCIFKGAIEDIELRKLIFLADLEYYDLQALETPTAPVAVCGLPPLHSRHAKMVSLFYLIDGALRQRFDIPDELEPVVAAGWKVYAEVPRRGGCEGCGGGCGDGCSVGEELGGDADDEGGEQDDSGI